MSPQPASPAPWWHQAITDFGAALQEREAWLVEAFGETQTYRILAQHSMQVIHRLERENQRLRAENARLLDLLRDEVIRSAAAV